MKVLIIHTGTIGEVLFATPLIRCIHLQRSASIEVLTTGPAAKILQENTHVKKVYGFSSVKAALTEISKNKYDYILDLDGTIRSFILSLFLKGKKKLRRELQLSFNPRSIPFPNIHLVDQYFRVADGLRVANDEHPVEYVIPYRDEVPEEWLPNAFQKGYVIFSIQAPYNTRKLPVSRMIELCDKINKPVIILGDDTSKDDGEVIEAFFKRPEINDAFEEGLLKLNKKTRVYNGCGKFNINQQASLIRNARAVFTFDNDALAIASAFGKEVISIWGNTVPAFGGYPYQTKFTLLENTKLSCRPCSIKGYEKCPLGHFKCMNEIVFDFYL